MVEQGAYPEHRQDQESILTREVAEATHGNARENLKSGSLRSTLFIQLENGDHGIVPLSLPEDSQEKQNYFALLGLSFQEMGHNIRGAILVAESWIV